MDSSTDLHFGPRLRRFRNGWVTRNPRVAHPRAALGVCSTLGCHRAVPLGLTMCRTVDPMIAVDPRWSRWIHHPAHVSGRVGVLWLISSFWLDLRSIWAMMGSLPTIEFFPIFWNFLGATDRVAQVSGVEAMCRDARWVNSWGIRMSWMCHVRCRPRAVLVSGHSGLCPTCGRLASGRPSRRPEKFCPRLPCPSFRTSVPTHHSKGSGTNFRPFVERWIDPLHAEKLSQTPSPTKSMQTLL